MNTTPNEPAYPSRLPKHHDQHLLDVISPGLSKREYFAAVALQGILANGVGLMPTAIDAATYFADAMLAALSATPEAQSPPEYSDAPETIPELAHQDRPMLIPEVGKKYLLRRGNEISIIAQHGNRNFEGITEHGPMFYFPSGRVLGMAGHEWDLVKIIAEKKAES